MTKDKLYLTKGAVIANLNECYDIDFTPKQRRWIKKELEFIKEKVDSGNLISITKKFSPKVTEKMSVNDKGLLCALSVYAANYRFKDLKSKLKNHKLSVGILSNKENNLGYKIMIRKELDVA